MEIREETRRSHLRWGGCPHAQEQPGKKIDPLNGQAEQSRAGALGGESGETAEEPRVSGGHEMRARLMGRGLSST